jgi:MFS transporter, FSR family, fosmidomycin resistance protein
MSFIAGTWGRFAAAERRTIGVACGAHMLHDGYTDLLYVLLPLWQTQFGLGYAEVGLLRALYTGSMATLQVPSGALGERAGGQLILGLGTALVGVGYLAAGASGGFLMLIAALVVAGIGGSVQHPIAANLVAQAFPGKRSRKALASYNFSGDLGKMAVPAATAWLVALLPWRGATTVLGAVALAVAAAILAARGLPDHRATPDPGIAAPQAVSAEAVAGKPVRRGFPLLLSVGMIDSATRMGFLTFLPFLLRMKGADMPMIGVALSLIFAGGAAGKLACGWLGARLGVVAGVFLTEGATAAVIVVLLPLPLWGALAILPLIGVALNGTSSVLYGTVPELVTPEKRQRAFGIFYTGTVGAGALSPVLYGLISDLIDVQVMMGVVAAVVLLTLPLTWALRPALRDAEAAD